MPPRILMFEDDTETTKDLKEYLEETYGYEVVLTAGQGILERLPTERFDLLILDLMIAHRSRGDDGRMVENVRYDGTSHWATGLEFLRRLRAGEYAGAEGISTPRDVPVIAYSAVASKPVQQQLLHHDYGILAYYGKPFRLNMIAQAIADILER
jgi:CheY-like chemotaxis protein